MKQKTAVQDLGVALFGISVLLLFSVCNDFTFDIQHAWLRASVWMLVVNVVVSSLRAGDEIKRQTVLIQDFFDNTVHELIEESVRFLVITVCCWFAPTPSLFGTEVQWVSVLVICICVGTFTVVRPLVRVVMGVIAVWKTFEEKKEEAK